MGKLICKLADLKQATSKMGGLNISNRFVSVSNLIQLRTAQDGKLVLTVSDVDNYIQYIVDVSVENDLSVYVNTKLFCQTIEKLDWDICVLTDDGNRLKICRLDNDSSVYSIPLSTDKFELDDFTISYTEGDDWQIVSYDVLKEVLKYGNVSVAYDNVMPEFGCFYFGDVFMTACAIRITYMDVNVFKQNVCLPRQSAGYLKLFDGDLYVKSSENGYLFTDGCLSMCLLDVDYFSKPHVNLVKKFALTEEMTNKFTVNTDELVSVLERIKLFVDNRKSNACIFTVNSNSVVVSNTDRNSYDTLMIDNVVCETGGGFACQLDSLLTFAKTTDSNVLEFSFRSDVSRINVKTSHVIYVMSKVTL